MKDDLAAICNTVAHWMSDPKPTDPGWSAQMWETVQFLSQVHGLAPLLHHRLSETAWLPPTMRLWLAEQYHFNQQRIAKMHQDLAAILACLAENNLPVMPLKGSILSAQVYPDPALRPMADLDLLVRPADFERATTLLIRLGYSQDTVHWKHTAFIKPDNCQVVSKTCEHPHNPRPVELHVHCREIFGGPVLDLSEAMWEAARPRVWMGQKTWLPAPEMLWLHLLVHATYHFWQGRGRLIHLIDLCYLTPQLTDPEPVLNRVDARYTFPGLALLDRYFPADLVFPPHLSQTMLAQQAGRVSPHFCRWADRLDLVNSSYLNPNPPGLYLSRALRFAEGRPREILQALRFSILPRLDELSLDHPRLAQSPFPWLAYFMLPMDWAKRLWGRN